MYLLKETREKTYVYFGRAKCNNGLLLDSFVGLSIGLNKDALANWFLLAQTKTTKFEFTAELVLKLIFTFSRRPLFLFHLLSETCQSPK